MNRQKLIKLIRLPKVLVYWVFCAIQERLGFIKRDQHIIILGTKNGHAYMDNSRYFFEWLLRERKSISPVWIASSGKVYKQLKNHSKPVVLSHSYAGVKLLFKAGYGAITDQLADIAFDRRLIPAGMDITFLSHGKSVKATRLALVKSDRTSIHHDYWKSEGMRMTKFVNRALATSPFLADLTRQSHGFKEIITTGFPKNDQLLKPSGESKKSWEIFLQERNITSPGKTILYAPSWRMGQKATRFFPYSDFEQEQLFSFLKKHNVLLLLRPHLKELDQFDEMKDFFEQLTHSENIFLATNHEFPDVSDFLPFVDCLISDYSSIYHDYLILDRPIFLVPYDYKEVLSERGFMYDYYKYIPGPEITTMESFFENLEILLAGEDSFKKKRKALQDLIHTHMDAKSSVRVYEEIFS